MSTLLGSLKLAQKPENKNSNPLIKRRERLLAKLDEQKAMATALIAGETYTCFKEKWQVNPDTQVREKTKVARNIKPWHYKRNNQYFLEIRYGNKPLELQKGLHAIQVGELENLVPTIDTIIAAIVAGELDELLVPIAPVGKGTKK